MINNYKVKINERQEVIYHTKIRASFNREPSEMPFVIGESNGEASIEIYSQEIVTDVCIRPLSYGIKCEFDTHTIRFTMPEKAKVSVEINNDMSTALGIFMNTPVEMPENTTVYYGAGRHDLKVIELHDNDVMYLEKGAYVRAKVLASGKNIRICGNGIISGELFNNRDDKVTNYLLELDGCRDCEVRDITLVQSLNWNMRVNGCDNLDISDIKIIGYRGNNDGIDVCGSRDVEVHDCFIRSTDDCLCVKGFNTGDVSNIHFYRCTLWNDYANPMRVGGIRADRAKHLVFEDIDIIHIVGGYPCFAYLEGNRAHVSDVRVENLRIEDSRNSHLFDVRVKRNMWTSDKITGSLKDISFKNVYLYGSEPKRYLPQESVFSGQTEENSIKGVTFENLFVYGKLVTSLAEAKIDIRENVSDVRFIYEREVDKSIDVDVAFEDMMLSNDGYYYGKVILSAQNNNDRVVCAMIRPEVLPDYTHTYNRFEMSKFEMAPGEKLVKEYDIQLRPGRYMVTAESDNIMVNVSRSVQEYPWVLKTVNKNTVKFLNPYQISDIDGRVMAEIALGKDTGGIWCRAEILNEQPDDGVPSISLYICRRPLFREKDAYFSAEETNEGRATALIYSENGLKTEPIMRCYGEIQWTLNNAPKYDKIVRIISDANGVLFKEIVTAGIRSAPDGNQFTVIEKQNTTAIGVWIDSNTKDNKTWMLMFVPYETLGFTVEDDVVIELIVDPVLTKNRYMNAFSMFGSPDPTVSTHMYCPIR